MRRDFFDLVKILRLTGTFTQTKVCFTLVDFSPTVYSSCTLMRHSVNVIYLQLTLQTRKT